MPRPVYNAEDSRRANEIGRLIRSERKKQGLTQAGLARALSFLGVSVRAAAVAKWENGDNVPSGYQLIALCHALNLQEGISAFSGPVVPADVNAEGYRILNEFHAFLASSGRFSPESRQPEAKTVEMRVYDLPVSAGTGSLLDGDHYEFLSFPASSVPEGADFGVCVTGDSMEPAFHDGQIVWVRSCEELRDGDVGVFFYDGSSYIKEYREFRSADGTGPQPRIIWHSLNPEYADIPITDGSYRLFGKVLNCPAG